jgi:excisionase family DNA binding protein
MDYELANGEVLHLPEPVGKTRVFWNKIRAALDDVGVSYDAFMGLLYSVENPLLDSGIFPDKPAVTKRTHASPLYLPMLDMLGRKHIQQSTLAPITVAEAASRLGVTIAAVHQAIAAKKIEAVKDGLHWKVSPVSVAAYRVGTRGPAAARAGRLRLVKDGDEK